MIPTWIRDPNVIKSSFKEMGGKWIALNDAKIYFPVHYEEKGLAVISDTVETLGIVCIRVGDAYAVLSVCARIVLSPSAVNRVDHDGEPYYELEFEKGSVVMESTKVVKNDILVYYISDTFISKGRIPWFMSYVDMCKIFRTAESHANSEVAKRPEIIELLVSLIARDNKDRSKYYRQVTNATHDVVNKVSFVPLKNIEFGATNTLSKLGGAYFQTGVVSALINPTERVENIESILRQ